MTYVKFKCRHCKQPLEATPEHYGEPIACPSCGKPITIPNPTSPKASALPRRRIVASKASSTSHSRKQVSDSSVYRMEGVAETLTVYSDKLEITPKGVLGFMVKGLKGTKTIYFASITGIQFKPSGFTSGYLQFTIPGGNESRRGVFDAAVDENTFMFASQNDYAIKIKLYIEAKMKEARQTPAISSTSSVSDEIERLAVLHQQGILTDEEFKQAKMKLLL